MLGIFGRYYGPKKTFGQNYPSLNFGQKYSDYPDTAFLIIHDHSDSDDDLMQSDCIFFVPIKYNLDPDGKIKSFKILFEDLKY